MTAEWKDDTHNTWRRCQAGLRTIQTLNKAFTLFDLGF